MYGVTSIVILSYNTLDLLQLCVESIRSFTDIGRYEIIVVENASTDGSAEWLKEQQDIKCIFNKENVGFPKGCNQGMEIARGDSILLLNSDTVVTPRWLDQLSIALYSNDDIGAVGCVTNKCTNYQAIEIPYTNIDEMITFAEEFNHSDSSKWVESFKLISFCMLFKREIYDKLGGLDEIFTPGIYEDDDYSLRIRLAGYRLLLCKDTFIHHFGNASFLRKCVQEEKAYRENFIRLLYRNTWKLCHKWNVSDTYNKEDGIVWCCIDNFINSERVLFIGSYSMSELMTIRRYNQNIKLEYITDNILDWNTKTTSLIQYNCANIIDDAEAYLSGKYDFIVLDDGMMKYDNALNFIYRLKSYTENMSNIYMRKYNILKIKSQIQKQNPKKISFITMVNNEDKYAEALANWKGLNIPRGMEVDYIAVRNAISMTDGCNKGMVQSDAKYKVYVHQDVFFENKNFLNILVNSFKKDKSYGIAGVVGCKDIPISGIWWKSPKRVGGIRDTVSYTKTPTRCFYQDKIANPVVVSGLDGLVLATQYDIPWRSDLFDKWHFYDMSQCMEFRRHGYKTIVLPQLDVLCFHDCGIPSIDRYNDERFKFLEEYRVELGDEIDMIDHDSNDYRNRLYTPTMINKIGDLYFIIDCWHGRVIYSDKVDRPILEWKIFADDVAGGHTIASDGDFYLIDDSENNAVRVFKYINNKFSEVQNIKTKGRPHYILYDEVTKKFFIILSYDGSIAACIVKDGIVCIEYIATIINIKKTNCYIRSINVIDGYMYVPVLFGVGVGAIFKFKYRDNSWHIIDKMMVSNNIAGINYICKIQDYFYVTVYTDNKMHRCPKVLRCKELSDLTVGRFELLNDIVGLQGTPYFINKFDNHYFLTEIDQFSGIKSFDVIDNQIVNIKEIFGWADILDSSIERKIKCIVVKQFSDRVIM